MVYYILLVILILIWASIKFLRRYEMMEMLEVFVYIEGDRPIMHRAMIMEQSLKELNFTEYEQSL